MPLYCEIQCAVYSPTGNLTWICLSRLCLRHAVRFPARSASDISVDPAGNPAGVKLRPRSAQHLCISSRFHSLRTHCRYGCDLDEICNRSTTRPLYHYGNVYLYAEIYIAEKGRVKHTVDILNAISTCAVIWVVDVMQWLVWVPSWSSTYRPDSMRTL